MEQNNFKGLVYLSTEQYEELKTNGTAVIEGVELTYDKYGTIYITPDENNKANQEYVDTQVATLNQQLTTLQTAFNDFKTEVEANLPEVVLYIEEE